MWTPSFHLQSGHRNTSFRWRFVPTGKEEIAFVNILLRLEEEFAFVKNSVPSVRILMWIPTSHLQISHRSVPFSPIAPISLFSPFATFPPIVPISPIAPVYPIAPFSPIFLDLRIFTDCAGCPDIADCPVLSDFPVLTDFSRFAHPTFSADRSDFPVLSDCYVPADCAGCRVLPDFPVLRDFPRFAHFPDCAGGPDLADCPVPPISLSLRFSPFSPIAPISGSLRLLRSRRLRRLHRSPRFPRLTRSRWLPCLPWSRPLRQLPRPAPIASIALFYPMSLFCPKCFWLNCWRMPKLRCALSITLS